MTLDPDQRARLELNASGHKPDPKFERLLTLFTTDRAAYDRLPTVVKEQAAVYADLKGNHTRAVAAGAITEETQ